MILVCFVLILFLRLGGRAVFIAFVSDLNTLSNDIVWLLDISEGIISLTVSKIELNFSELRHTFHTI